MVVVDKRVDVEFYRLPVEEVKHLLSSEEVNVEQETQIIEVINQWIAADFENRDKFRPMLMSTVRFLALDQQVFLKFSF